MCVIDWIGSHGQTQAPATGYDRATLARDIVAFQDALGLERAAIVGHDWGGIIACKLALDHPERVSRLALLDTICTGWPVFVTYFYWFMDPGRAEAFFAKHSHSFIRSIIGGRPDAQLPAPPECPVEFANPALTAPSQFASDADLEAYTAPYRAPGEITATLGYYRSMQFHRVLPDGSEPHGERYEAVSHQEMGRRWRDGTAGGEYLDYAVEDRHKTYHGPTLWLYSSGLVQAAQGAIDADGIPQGDPAFASFPRHFPRLRAAAIDAGHFFPEEAPGATARHLLEFL